MLDHLIVCRSLTYAQRSVSLLERNGITSRMIRTPRATGRSCGYSVRVSRQNAAAALALLRENQLSPKAVYRITDGGGYEEAEL